MASATYCVKIQNDLRNQNLPPYINILTPILIITNGEHFAKCWKGGEGAVRLPTVAAEQGGLGGL